MRLTGSVDPRGFLSLLALLESSAASGTLKVSNDETHAALALVRGDVVVAESALRRPFRLADLLPGDVPAARRTELKRAIARARGKRAFEVAVGGGYATVEAVREGMARLIDEELFELFTWSEVHLQFDAADPSPFELAIEAGRAFQLDAKAFRMTAGGRLEGWQTLTQRLSTPKLIMNTKPRKAWLVDELMQSEDLPEDALRFDGVRTLAEVVGSWHRPSYMAYRFVSDLLEQDLIEPLPTENLIKAFADAQLDDDGRSFRYYEAIVESRVPVGDQALDRRLLSALQGVKGGGRLSVRCSGRRALTLLIELWRNRCEAEVRVTAARTRRVFSVKDGALTLASSAPATGTVPDYLVRQGKVTRSRLKRAKAEQRRSGSPLPQVLISSFGVAAGDWVQALCDRVLDELLQIFFLRSSFCELRAPASGKGPKRTRAKVPFATEGFAAAFKEGLAELEGMLEGLPTARTLLERTEAEGAGTGLCELFDGRQALADVLLTLKCGQRELLRFVQRAIADGRLRVIEGPALLERAEAALAGGRSREAEELSGTALDAGYEPRERFEELVRAATSATRDTQGRSLLEGEAGGVNLSAFVQHLHSRRQTGRLTLEPGVARAVHQEQLAGVLSLYLVSGELWLLPASAVRGGEGEAAFAALARLSERGPLHERRLPAKVRGQMHEALAARIVGGARFRFEEGRLPRAIEEAGASVLAIEIDTHAMLLSLCTRLASIDPEPWPLRRGDGEEE